MPIEIAGPDPDGGVWWNWPGGIDGPSCIVGTPGIGVGCRPPTGTACDPDAFEGPGAPRSVALWAFCGPVALPIAGAACDADAAGTTCAFVGPRAGGVCINAAYGGSVGALSRELASGA
jgi:hypothetical protein